MHEYSLVRRLLEQTDDVRRAHGAARVVAVRLIVGEFSGVEPELLRSAFAVLSEGTPAAQATLELERRTLSGLCRECGSNFAVIGFRFRCPSCGAAAVQVTGGEELTLESVTLEPADV